MLDRCVSTNPALSKRWVDMCAIPIHRLGVFSRFYRGDYAVPGWNARGCGAPDLAKGRAPLHRERKMDGMRFPPMSDGNGERRSRSCLAGHRMWCGMQMSGG